MEFGRLTDGESAATISAMKFSLALTLLVVSVMGVGCGGSTTLASDETVGDASGDAATSTNGDASGTTSGGGDAGSTSSGGSDSGTTASGGGDSATTTSGGGDTGVTVTPPPDSGVVSDAGACKTDCTMKYMSGYEAFLFDTVQTCGCTASGACASECAANCSDPTSITPSSPCGTCIGGEVSKGLTSTCLLSAVGNCNGQPTCRQFLACVQACPGG
jgi:hypothetical protein